MAEGIRQSAVIVLFLSAGVFKRPFVVFEIEHAIKFGKPIKLVHEEDKCELVSDSRLGSGACPRPR